MLRISQNSRKIPNSWKSSNSWTRADSNSWPRKEQIPAPLSTLIYEVSMMSMVWNISTGQLGLAAWLCSLPAPAPLLTS